MFRVKKMSLTHEQKELLKALARVHGSGDHGSFVFSRSIDQVDSATLVYDGHPNVVVHNVDESDFIHLEREGLLTLRQSSGDLSGKPTMKGSNLAMRSIPSDQRTQRPPGSMSPPAPRTASPPAKRTAPPPSGATGSQRIEPLEPAENPLDVRTAAGRVEAARQLLSGSGAEKPNRPDSIFIGHGGSKEWLELEKYLTRELHLNCEEFNTESAAGYTTQQRLETMLDRATFAFLVLTAEDKHADGSLHARENVIHEAGLFQGKLGRPNAILLIETGCATPSNISGLTHIPFPNGHIRATFHEVRRVLVARKIIVA